MQVKADSPEDYINKIADDKKEGIIRLREVILKNLPKGFVECMIYGMIGYVVPHSIFPDGYHCDPKLPLPFASIAAQKNFIGLYHMGIYANPEMLDWFVSEHKKASPKKLDMGKSCVRYKKVEDIPFELIGELFSKMSPEDWVNLYLKSFRSSKTK